MPTYKVQDQQTGKTITFDWQGQGEPTDADMEQVFAAAAQQQPAPPKDPANPLDLPVVEEKGPSIFESFREGLRSKNVADSAERSTRALATPFMHPIQTAKDLHGLGAGLIEKIIPGEQPHEGVVDAVGEYFKDRYGSVAGAQKAMEQDPFGVMLDVSSVMNVAGGAAKVAGKVASVAPGLGKAGQTVAKIGGQVAQAGDTLNPFTMARQGLRDVTAPARKHAARKLYRSALKPSTAKRPEKLEKIIETGLREGIPTTTDGARKVNKRIWELENTIDDVVSTAKDGRVSTEAVVDAVRDWARKDVPVATAPEKWTKAVDRALEDFTKGRPSASLGKATMYVDDAQEIKRRLYKEMQGIYEARGAIVSRGMSYRAAVGQKIAQAIKTEIEKLAPELKDLNWSQGELIELRKEVARAANRIANRDVFGMGDFLGVGVGGHIAGPQGALIGLAARQALTRPSISSRLGIRLYRDSAGKALGRSAAGIRILEESLGNIAP